MVSQDKYYVRFRDDACEYVGCDEMTAVLDKDTSRRIQTIAFGEDWDSYCIVYTDGTEVGFATIFLTSFRKY